MRRQPNAEPLLDQGGYGTTRPQCRRQLELIRRFAADQAANFLLLCHGKTAAFAHLPPAHGILQRLGTALRIP